MPYTGSKAFTGSNATTGTIIEYCATSTGTYTPFAEIKKITTAKKATGKVKVTNFQTLNKTHEYIPGFNEPGDYEFQANMTDTDNVLARSIQGTPYFFKIIFPNPITTAGTTRAFQGWVSEVSEDPEPDKEVTHSIKITVTGIETVTAAS